MTNALFALDAGWRGQGVLVGVIDNGAMEVGDLQGQINHGLSRDFGGTIKGGQLVPRNVLGSDSSSHGTAVAALIAGKRDGRGMQGFAPEAQLVVLRTDFYNEDTQSQGYGIDLDRVVRYANTMRIPILNLSLSKEIGSPSSRLIEAVTEYHRGTRGLIVNSAGNSQVAGPGFMVEATRENEQSWLFVVAVEPSVLEYKLASYSNTCGRAMNRCVAAIGQHTTMGIDGGTQVFGGTSAAAPQVAALAAAILSKWPQLTGVDAGNIILNTARDLGAPGLDNVYGHGLVDFEAALRPVSPVLSNGRVTTGIDSSAMVLGSAFSSGPTPTSVEQSLSGVRVVDRFGRDFAVDLAGMVVRPQQDRARLNRQIEAHANAGQVGVDSPSATALIGYTALPTGLIENGLPVLRNQITNARVALRLNSRLSLVAGLNSDNNTMDDIFGLAPTSDAMFAYAPVAQMSFGISRQMGKGELIVQAYSGEQQGLAARGVSASYLQGPFTVKFGLADEVGTVFGTPVGLGMLRFGDGARSGFVEVSSGVAAGRWKFDGYVSLGATRLRLAEDMLMTDASEILTTRYGLFARRGFLNGTLSFGMAQDTVAVAGHASFALARRYDLQSRSLIYENERVSLAGRMAPQFVLGYEQTGRRSSLNVGIASDPQARDARGVASWQMKF
ncbi:S8 family serine peptidase [Leptolyngbya sp. AN03gr2]|uniref:S8 family serine peptidase n=1 Tax=Leptolyngbya sp. AN03gr2 TaxID=3423364 RepID=UPI003D316B23